MRRMEIPEEYSVALCTYNGEKYIGEQLTSILNQSVPPKEIIISDDGSKDHTLDVAQKLLKSCSIEHKIVKNQGNHGVTGNFINAISLCSSPYVFTSDQDDVWMKNKAERMLRVFGERENALLVFSDGELVDQNLEPLNCSMWESVGITEEMLLEESWYEYLLNRCLVTGAAMAFKRELFSADDSIPSSWLHDGWLTWKAVARNGLAACPDKLILYRQHKNNVVGMSSVTSWKRVKSYIHHFTVIRDKHKERYQRYLDLEEKLGDMFSAKENAELRECITFWKDLIKADQSKNRVLRLKIINKHMKNNDFNKYFNGKKGAFREILVALLF